MRGASRGAGLAVMAALLVASCSLVLEWNPEGQRCDNGKCLESFSCLVNRCVGDQTLDKGQTCNNSDQCFEGLICAPTLFTCRAPCASKSFYKPTASCGAGEYCKPFLDDTNQWVGVCVPGDECGIDGDCRAGEVCVKISATAFSCQTSCQISWNAGSYRDNCGSTAIDPKLCQPIGATDAERLVCVDIEKEGALPGVGEPCAPIDNPCRSPIPASGPTPGEGFSCIQNSCRRYCDVAAGTSGNPSCPGQICCTRGTSPNIYGVCDSTCNF